MDYLDAFRPAQTVVNALGWVGLGLTVILLGADVATFLSSAWRLHVGNGPADGDSEPEVAPTSEHDSYEHAADAYSRQAREHQSRIQSFVHTGSAETQWRAAARADAPTPSRDTVPPSPRKDATRDREGRETNVRSPR